MVGRLPILDVAPQLEGGRYAAKASIGEPFEVSAVVIREGHDALAADVVLTGPDGAPRHPVRLQRLDSPPDRWVAEVTADAMGPWTFQVRAWSDPLATWRHHAEIKVPAEIDVEMVLTEGAQLLERVAASLPVAPRRGAGKSKADPAAAGRKALEAAVRALLDTSRPDSVRLAAALSPEVQAALAANPLRELLTTSDPFPVFVDRERALYGAWYELFPRSEGAKVDKRTGKVVTGTFKTAAKRLPAVAAMGFDVVYLPPIHPVGQVNRKGPNNTLVAGPDDVGSPWAIGSEEGGHDAVHPDLGTQADFKAFVRRANTLGLEVAIDLALQCAPDHPWVKTNPEWFNTRVDGTIAYAENPPKKYQDIYPVNFDHDPDGIYAEVLRVVRHWMAAGVRIFRVDNPHTKPVEFWEWLLGEVRATDPDVVFLSEAFTRPAMMHALAMVGFHQSYTYFTWRNTKPELESYLTELAHETPHLMRPNLFVNTPDILHEYLQYGGPAAFKIRATLAALGAPSWGMYAGFELFEHVAVRPGSEEYLDSEKFQLRPRDWAEAEASGRSLAPYVTMLNRLRREHPALRLLRNVAFHRADDESILAFSKVSRDAAGEIDDTVLVVVNIDPHAIRETTVHLDMATIGLDWSERFLVHDEVSGEDWVWGEDNYVRLDPFHQPAHVLTIKRPPS